MSGFSYEVNIKTYSQADIAKDIAKWPPEIIKAAFISLAASLFKENWPDIKVEFMKDIKGIINEE
jgi:hypothetical protein